MAKKERPLRMEGVRPPQVPAGDREKIDAGVPPRQAPVDKRKPPPSKKKD